MNQQVCSLYQLDQDFLIELMNKENPKLFQQLAINKLSNWPLLKKIEFILLSPNNGFTDNSDIFNDFISVVFIYPGNFIDPSAKSTY